METLEKLDLSVSVPKPEPKKRGRKPKEKAPNSLKTKRPRKNLVIQSASN
jgi:hypothetical protein